MSSKVESTEREEEDEDLSCGLLLRDIEEISKALYLHQAPRKPFNSSHERSPSISTKTGVSGFKPCGVIESLPDKGKKSSSWKWKPLKALAHIRNNRFNCCFFLHVHAVEGLPPNFENLSLCVIWNRKNSSLRTRPSGIQSGMAAFEETLMHRCTVYSSRSGPRGSVKYEPKIFSLSVAVLGPLDFDLGNHWIDLSRLLPATLEELEGDKSSSGKWNSSFKLTGKASGAILNVSFGFSILGGNSFEPGYFVKVPDIGGLNNHLADFDKESELSHSVTLLYRKLDEKKMGGMIDFDHLCDSEFCETIAFDVIEQEIEISKEDKIKLEKCDSQKFGNAIIETIDVDEIFDDEVTAFDECVISNSKLSDNFGEHKYDKEPTFIEDSMALYDMLTSKSLISMDDVSESIENEFLDMLGIDQSLDIEGPDAFDQLLNVEAGENNQNTLNRSSLRSRRDAKVLENLETEALMHDWGLSDTAFQYSPHIISGGFGSPIYIPTEEPLKLPPIEGVGPMIRTRDGSYLRSMNPLIFANANNGTRLIIHVSAPVVLPPEMGFTVMDVLQCWASVGCEKMCIQVNELMPLEDVTGKRMREVMLEADSRSDVTLRDSDIGVELLVEEKQRDSDIGVELLVEEKQTEHPPSSDNCENFSCSNPEPIDPDYVSFEDLVPLSITNIEGLILQGLKIQSGMADEEAPSSIQIRSTGPSCNFSSGGASHGFTSLDEWLRLDSSEFRVQDGADENKISDISGKNLKMGFKVQIRDPFRNYEMVGPAMLAVVGVERIYSLECQRIDRPLFKVSEAHLVGFNVKKQVWGSSRQHLSGSRWLFSSGMTKSDKNLVSTSNAVVKYSLRKTWAEDVLWSICVPSRDGLETWDEQVGLNVHVRNPDIVFLTDSK